MPLNSKTSIKPKVGKHNVKKNTINKNTIKKNRKNPVKTTHNKTRKNTSNKNIINKKKRLRKKNKYNSRQHGAGDKCDPKTLDKLLSGNPIVSVSQEMPKQSIKASDFAAINGKGLGKSPGPPPSLPSGCIIL